jgi:glycosyltransferase involved in cell wall biosynthesis
MLIGLDAIPLTETRTGVGHYTFELARALAAVSPGDEFELAYPATYPQFDLEELAGGAVPANLRSTRVGVGAFGRHWWSFGLPRYARRRGFHLFHGTNYDVPLWGRCPAVLTVHDLSAYSFPETLVARRARRLRLRLPLMLRRAALVITPTESVREELRGRFGTSPAKVRAVPEAPREVFRPLAREEAMITCARLGVTGDFLLAVGTIEPRKNLRTLLQAFGRLASDGAAAPDVRLVLAGKIGWLADELFADVASSPARERVLFTGYVSDEELRALYSSCLAFVYPSLYEGFGLPPLEAAACGAPVVASRTPALVETLGERAARFFPSKDAGALARLLSELIADEAARRRLSREGVLRASGFTWERAARLTLGAYETAFGGGRARRE